MEVKDINKLIFRLFTLIIFAVAFTSGCFSPSGIDSSDPNILLIVMDAARADHFSCYDYHRRTTPNIDRMAAEGLRFTQAVSSSSWTLPSHASLFTGLLPYEHGTNTQHTWLLDRLPTLAELLKTRGYRTAGFSNNPRVDKVQNMARGFDLFEAVWADTTVVSPRKPYNTAHTTRLVKGFLEDTAGSEQPFFIFINYMNTHLPYRAPESYRKLFLNGEQKVTACIDSALYHPIMVNSGVLPLRPQEFETIRAIYDGALNYLDSQIGELLDFLKKHALYDSTLVVITSDHGEMFGEYGHFTHGRYLYRPLVQIPLIIRYKPLIPDAEVSQTPVSIVDIFHSILRVLKIEAATATGAPVRYLFDALIEPRPCYSEVRVNRIHAGGGIPMKFNSRSLWTPEGLHYIFFDDGSLACFDLKTDPDETVNLCPHRIDPNEVLTVIETFETGLNALVETEQDLRIVSEVQQYPQQREALRAIGYVGPREQDLLTLTTGEHPHVMEHLKTGAFLYNRDSLDAAEREFRTAFTMSPINPDIRKCLGKVLVKRGENEEAVRLLRSILNKMNTDTEIRLLLAQGLIALGKDEEALQVLRKASTMHFSDPQLAFKVARILMKQGDLRTAGVFLSRILEENQNELEMMRRIIGMHCRYENWGPARKLLLKEISKAPSVDAYYLLSYACIKLARVDEARRYLQMLLTMNTPPLIREKVEKQLKKL